MGGIMTTVNDSTLPSLKAQERNAPPRSRWMLRDIVVGIGLSFSAGLGPIFSLTASPRLRFIFSNSTHPAHAG
jgi:hypothetical protein